MADRIVGEYSIKVDEAVKNLDKLAGRVGKLEDANKKAAKNTESEYTKMVNGLTGQFKNLAGAIGIAFGTQQIVALGREMVTLAAQAEGVERAFKRVGSPQLLADLRKATRGTVSDLQLMQNAVKASNFKIPLENLAALFRFAQARARETGESVDYLVDSIILGIGRKSPLILDNLGISAVELRERLKGVGVEASSVGDIAQIIGDIATEELAKMGDQADTTADKIAQISTAFENMKVEGGEALILLIEDIGNAWDKLQFGNKVKETEKQIAEAFREGTRAATNTIKNIEELNKTEESRIKQVEVNLKFVENAYDSEQKKIAELLAEQESLAGNTSSNARKRITAILNEIAESDNLSETYLAQIDVFAKYLDLKNEDNDATQKQILNVAYYKKLIADLTTEQEDANTTLERNYEINKELAVAREELARLLGKLTEKQREYNKALKEMPIKEANTRFGDYVLKARDGRVSFEFLGDSLDGLNTLLKEQQDILNNAPEFSKQYKDASNAIDELQQKIKEFSDNQIDPSLGFPGISTEGIDSASGINFEDLQSELSMALELWSNFYNSINELQSLQNQLALQDLEERFRSEEITREEYEEKKKQLLREEAARQKSLAIFQAIVGTAQAVIQALNAPPPASFIFAALAAATGAAQIGIIASQPTPQFAEGGWVDNFGQFHGRKHAQGGITIEAEGGEFITSAKYAKPNAEILKAINSGNWEQYKVENIIAPAIEEVMKGGFEGMGASYQLNSMFNDKNLLKAIDRHRVSDKEGFKYLATEITRNLRQPKRGGYS